MRFTIKAKLAITFGILVLMLAGAGVLSYWSLSVLNETITNVVEKSAKRVEVMGQMKAALVGSIKSEKDAILATSDETIAKASESAKAANTQFRKGYDELFNIASEEGKKALDGIKTVFDRRIGIQDDILDLAKKNSSARALDLANGDGLAAYKQLAAALQHLRDAATTSDAQLAIVEFERDVQEARGMIKGYIAANDLPELQEVGKRLTPLMSALRASKDDLRKTLEATASAAAAQASDAFDAWYKVQEQVIATAAEGGTIKAHEKSVDAVQQTGEVMSEVDDYLDLVRNQMAQAREEAAGQYHSSVILLVSIVSIAFAVSMAAAIWLSLNISRGLGRAVGLANAVAIGDLNQSIQVTANDEIKDLVDSLNGMTANLAATAKVADCDLPTATSRSTTKRLSDKDTLGIALENMVEKLRSIVTEALSASDNVSSGSQELSATSEQLAQGSDRAGLRRRGGLVFVGGDGRQHQAERRQRQRDREDRPPVGQGRRGLGRRSRPCRHRHADHRREDHHRAGDRPPDRPARPQRRRRGGPRRRARQGLRGGRLRSAQARRAQPDGGGRDRHPLGRQRQGRAGGRHHARRSSCPTSSARPSWSRRSPPPAASRMSARLRSTRRSSRSTR